MAIFLTDQHVNELLPMNVAIEKLEQGFQAYGSGLAVNIPRQRPQVNGTSITMMIAVMGDTGFSGFKTMGAGKPLVSLYGGKPSTLLAIMEASMLGQIRTGAATGLATKYMAKTDASSIGIVGTGFQAKTQLEAVCSVRNIKSIKAYSRTKEKLEKFCSDMSNALGLSIEPAQSAQAAVQDTDICIAITNVRTLEPVIKGEWLKAGTHVNAAGANSLDRREVDDQLISLCSLIVADDIAQAKIECSDLVIPVANGILKWDSVIELGQLIANTGSNRLYDPESFTLFESQGIALEDIAVAAHVFESAISKGIGEYLPF